MIKSVRLFIVWRSRVTAEVKDLPALCFLNREIWKVNLCFTIDRQIKEYQDIQNEMWVSPVTKQQSKQKGKST